MNICTHAAHMHTSTIDVPLHHASRRQCRTFPYGHYIYRLEDVQRVAREIHGDKKVKIDQVKNVGAQRHGGGWGHGAHVPGGKGGVIRCWWVLDGTIRKLN